MIKSNSLSTERATVFGLAKLQISIKSFIEWIRRDRVILILVLVSSLINGLLFVALVPPWEHYDEPTQFEYAWLVANRSYRPEPGDYDQKMRREVAASMVENKFFNHLNFRPNLLSSTDPVWIGISQTSDPPLYYYLAAIPLRLLRFTDIVIQLYAARLVSLLLFLITILLAWGIIREITPKYHPLHWMVPLTLALLPGFVDSMTAVNNDVGAVALFSLFLWSNILLLRRGVNIFRILVVVITAGLSILTKNTIYIVVPLGLLIIFLAFFKGKKQWLSWAILGAGILAIIITSFSLDNAAGWLYIYPTEIPTQSRGISPVTGDHAIQIKISPTLIPPELFQWIRPDKATFVRGYSVTLGAWIWAEEPVDIVAPKLSSSDANTSNPPVFSVTTKPQFYAYTIPVPKNVYRLWISLAPEIYGSNRVVKIFYDDLVLVRGKRPLDQAPKFDDSTGQTGIWGAKHFTNLVQNASGENIWPRLKTRIDQLGLALFPGHPSLILGSLMDLPAIGWYYQNTAVNLFQTFWAKFGWGNVPLIFNKTYYLLFLVTLIGIIGFIWMICTKWRELDKRILFLFAFALCCIWGFTLVRGTDTMRIHLFFPASRYAFPAVIPTVLLLCLGWLEVFRNVKRWLKLPDRVFTIVYLLSFLGLDVFALISLIDFYSRR